MKSIIIFFSVLLFLCKAVIAQHQQHIISNDDLNFLKKLTKDVMDSSRIYPGQVIASSLKNNTHGTLIRPGGRDDYPSFWIRDYAMSLETGMVSPKEQLHMLLITAATQCNQTWITKNGSIIPYGSIADHIRITDSLPIYFPGTYDYVEQGNKIYGMMPPLCDEFYFVHMASYYVASSGNSNILFREINGMRLIDRLEIAFSMPPSRTDNGIVHTDSSFRAVDFGFRDAIEITGDLCLSSILKYKAATELSQLFKKLKNKKKAKKYEQLAQQIKSALPVLFCNKKGMLQASNGQSNQPDVWATALAVYYGILEGDALKKACRVLSEAYANGTLAYKGNIRHILTTDDYNEKTAWQVTNVEKNRYQNGAYWGTATGWVCFAIAKENHQQGRQLAKEYITDLRENDFRKGGSYGAPYECFYPPEYKQNPLYLATVACPYIVFKSLF
ncbi:MAG TPA: hypothetical protein VMT76_13085 [Puia sp.]|nr:hypothetical protein [Puia sp.]